MGFNEFLQRKDRKNINDMRPIELFNAGEASRQAEVDELQKRIDKALYKLPWLNWKNIDGKMKGEIMDILKGKKDE